MLYVSLACKHKHPGNVSEIEAFSNLAVNRANHRQSVELCGSQKAFDKKRLRIATYGGVCKFVWIGTKEELAAAKAHLAVNSRNAPPVQVCVLSDFVKCLGQAKPW